MFTIRKLGSQYIFRIAGSSSSRGAAAASPSECAHQHRSRTCDNIHDTASLSISVRYIPCKESCKPPLAASMSTTVGSSDAASKGEKGGPTVLPYYLANKPVYANQDLHVTDKYSGEVAYKVARAGAGDIEKAIAAAVVAAGPMAALASYQRREILEHCVTHFKARAEELAFALAVEAGKPIKDSRGEVTRLIDTFVIAMEESTRIYGEWAPMDLSARTAGFSSITRRFPIGPISMVSPFNFPLNLTAHKVAPALAVGCPFVLKPASRTPVGALIVGEVLASAPHLPEGAFSILPVSRDGADLFTTDDRFKLLTFTGSPAVGWQMKRDAGKKKVTLELGGNAGCIIEDVLSEEELQDIVSKLVFGAYYQSGQSCISVQRIFVRKDHYKAVRDALAEAVKSLKKGDPKLEDTFIGPLIAEKEAERVERWVKDAASRGGKILAGGNRVGAMMDATLMEGVPRDCDLVIQEAFGPVAVLEPYDTFKEAVESVNDSKYGLQCGVFTHDIGKAFYAFEHCQVGGVVINHVPSIRVDAQAYGGVKESGLGREGVKYAMKDYTEERVMMIANTGQI